MCVCVGDRWQTYNLQREEHVQALQQKLKKMEVKLSETKNVEILEQQQQKRIDQLMQEYMRKVHVMEEDKVKVSDINDLTLAYL